MSEVQALAAEVQKAKDELAKLQGSISVKESMEAYFKQVNEKVDPLNEGYKEENPWTKGQGGGSSCIIM